MRSLYAILTLLLFAVTAAAAPSVNEKVKLPEPAVSGPGSFEQLLAQRRSSRSYRPLPLELADIGQLLWAAQGITDRGIVARRHRHFPGAPRARCQSFCYQEERW